VRYSRELGISYEITNNEKNSRIADSSSQQSPLPEETDWSCSPHLDGAGTPVQFINLLRKCGLIEINQ
jgi:hypothetical protein